MNLKVGLVTILFNSDDVLDDFFSSVSKQTFKSYKLYVVDNSANEKTDRILEDCLKKYPVSEYEYINTRGNIGVAAGNNIGIKKALQDGCSHVLILNNDIVISQDHNFERMAELSKKESLITTKIFYFDSRKIWMAGGFLNHNKGLGVHYGMRQEDHPKYNIEKYVTYAPTCYLWVSAEVFSRIGFMDEKYFAYYDDTDFVLRAVIAGYKIWYEPSLDILHKVSSSSGGDNSPFYIFYGNRNKIYFIRKNYSGIRKLYLLIYTILTRSVMYLRFDKVGKQKLVKGIKEGFRIPL